MVMALKETVSDKIIEAAERRFKHYGYAKTSMADIASDLNMSPGNLYRFFPGKIDIALAIAATSLTHEFENLRKVAEDTSIPPVQRLRDLFHLDMIQTYTHFAAEPRVFEIAQIIKTERPEWINAWLRRQRELIDKILAEGVARGDFDLPDVNFTAEMLQTALMKFRYPQLWSNLPLPALEREFEGVCRLLLVGLAGPSGAARHAPCPIGTRAETPAASDAGAEI